MIIVIRYVYLIFALMIPIKIGTILDAKLFIIMY